MAGLLEDREIATVDHLPPGLPRPPHHCPEVGIELRRATRQIQGMRGRQLEVAQHLRRRLAVHFLAAVGAGLDMAMDATQIAPIAQIDLDGFECCPAKRRKIRGREQRQRIMCGRGARNALSMVSVPPGASNK